MTWSPVQAELFWVIGVFRPGKGLPTVVGQDPRSEENQHVGMGQNKLTRGLHFLVFGSIYQGWVRIFDPQPCMQ